MKSKKVVSKRKAILKPKKIVFENRTEYFLNGVRHREDGPAYIDKDGTEEWYLYGQLHREDGPAYIRKNGSEVWYLYGQLHREDGPALIKEDGTEVWYLHGLQLTEKQVNKRRSIKTPPSPKEPHLIFEKRIGNILLKAYEVT